MANNNELVTKEITLSMGPQHPSTHGVLHLLLDMKGEKIVRAYPDIGYLHRGTEKIAENLLYHQFVPYTDRLDYMAGMSNNLAYVMAVEKLLGIEVTERAKYIRVVAAELSRIAGHLLCVGAWGLDLGAMTVLLYAFREREMVLDLFEMICGARMTHNYLRVGGVRYDLQPAFREKCLEFADLLPQRLKDYEQLLTENRIWLKRNKGVGVISAEDAINLGLSGPIVRSSGVKWDIRKDEPYLVYDRFAFDIPTGENGDCFDRYIVRMEEMRQAAKIIKQALSQIPDGKPCVDMPEVVLPPRKDIETNMEALINHFKLISHGFKVPKGEAYASIESPKGELGFYIVSDGGSKPYRIKVRPPCFAIYQAYPELIKGHMIADAVAVMGSLNVIAGELDR